MPGDGLNIGSKTSRLLVPFLLFSKPTMVNECPAAVNRCGIGRGQLRFVLTRMLKVNRRQGGSRHPLSRSSRYWHKVLFHRMQQTLIRESLADLPEGICLTSVSYLSISSRQILFQCNFTLCQDLRTELEPYHISDLHTQEATWSHYLWRAYVLPSTSDTASLDPASTVDALVPC